MSIRDITEKFKHILDDSSYKDVTLIGIIVLLAFASFGLGRLSIQHNSTKEIRVGEREFQSVPAAVYTSVEQENEGTKSVNVVSSQNSEVYHFTWCSGAARIKEENKVFYSSIEEARAAGLRPAKNCKGLE